MECYENKVSEGDTETCMQPKRIYLGSSCEWFDTGNHRYSLDYVSSKLFYGKTCFIIFTVWNTGDDGI